MKTHSLIAHIAFLVFFSLMQITCKNDPPVVPPPYQQSIFLTVVDSGLTEVYLSLSMTDTLPPRGFEIFRNNNKVLSGSLFGKETTMVDTTAILNTSYTYQAFRVDGVLRNDSSAVIATKTLDTTSHEFVWTEYRFGNEPSVLRDVHIIEQNNIWSVGELWLNDSIGTSSDPYNAVYWDGTRWNVLQIPVRDYGTLIGTFPLLSVYGFSDSDVWMAGYADLILWDGSKFSSKAFFMLDLTFNGQVNKLWGTQNNNMYIAGRNGAMYRFTNPAWQKMNSGTTVDLTDVWGTPDGSTVWACGYKSNFTSSVLLQYSKHTDTWQTLWTKSGALIYPFDIVGSIWGNRKLYVANGAEVYELNGSAIKKHSPWFQNFIYHIRGNGENDIVAVTGGGGIWHFNGSNWKKIYSNAQRSLYSVAIKGNMIVAVGIDESSFPEKALIVVGKR